MELVYLRFENERGLGTEEALGRVREILGGEGEALLEQPRRCLLCALSNLKAGDLSEGPLLLTASNHHAECRLESGEGGLDLHAIIESDAAGEGNTPVLRRECTYLLRRHRVTEDALKRGLECVRHVEYFSKEGMPLPYAERLGGLVPANSKIGG